MGVSFLQARAATIGTALATSVRIRTREARGIGTPERQMDCD